MRGNGRDGTVDLDAEQLLDLGAVLLLHRGEGGDEELLVHRHDILVRVDPADLGVDAVNSVACRLVNDGSARNAGAISNTLPKPAGCAICLKNCGLCAR